MFYTKKDFYTKSLIVCFLFLMGLSSFANAEQTYSLKVLVKNLRNSKGCVQFTLYNKKGSIPDEYFKKYYKKIVVKINDRSAHAVFINLPKGRYAVNVLHDENKNGKMDKGFFLPTEGIGFSNYHSIGLTNKPNFEKASFELNKDMSKTIQIIYF